MGPLLNWSRRTDRPATPWLFRLLSVNQRSYHDRVGRVNDRGPPLQTARGTGESHRLKRPCSHAAATLESFFPSWRRGKENKASTVVTHAVSRRRSQVVRQRSAKPPSPVRIRAALSSAAFEPENPCFLDSNASLRSAHFRRRSRQKPAQTAPFRPPIGAICREKSLFMRRPSVPVAASSSGLFASGLRQGSMPAAASMSHSTGAGVSAGQFQARMTHDLLNDPRGNSGGIRQCRGLASERMEVEEQPRGVAVRDAGGLQIRPEASWLPCPRAAERPASRVQRGHVGGQVVGQVSREGQRRRLAVLGVCGGHGHARGLPVERLGRDAADFARIASPVATARR